MPYPMNKAERRSGQPAMNRSKYGYQNRGWRKTKRGRTTAFVTAVQLDLDTEGFRYNKWGGGKYANVAIGSSTTTVTSTVSQEAFAKTHQLISPGVYLKTASVWAEVAEMQGK
jgi:hypothetical protein